MKVVEMELPLVVNPCLLQVPVKHLTGDGHCASDVFVPINPGGVCLLWDAR